MLGDHVISRVKSGSWNKTSSKTQRPPHKSNGRVFSWWSSSQHTGNSARMSLTGCWTKIIHFLQLFWPLVDGGWTWTHKPVSHPSAHPLVDEKSISNQSTLGSAMEMSKQQSASGGQNQSMRTTVTSRVSWKCQGMWDKAGREETDKRKALLGLDWTDTGGKKHIQWITVGLD